MKLQIAIRLPKTSKDSILFIQSIEPGKLFLIEEDLSTKDWCPHKVDQETLAELIGAGLAEQIFDLVNGRIPLCTDNQNEQG